MFHFISEIPLFHFINARITFANINGIVTPVPGVHSQQVPATEMNADDEEETENQPKPACSIDLEYFDAPTDYVNQTIARQHTSEFFSI